MGQVEFADFRALSEQQGVRLHDQIVQAGQGIELDKACANSIPTPMLRAVWAAGYVLRLAAHPPEPLLYEADEFSTTVARHPIEPNEAISQDTAAKSLLDIANASIEPQEYSDFTHNDSLALDTCSSAEAMWIKTLRSLAAVEGLDDHLDYGCQIITDGDYPLLLRKHKLEPSALTLVRLIIDGVPYPAGSLVKLGLHQEASGSTYDIKVPKDRLEQIDVDNVSSVSFLRLSTLALRPEERDDLTLHRNWYAEETCQILASLTIVQVQDTARQKLRYARPLS